MEQKKNNKKILITIWDPTNSKTTLGILDMSPLLKPSKARAQRALASVDFYTNLDPLPRAHTQQAITPQKVFFLFSRTFEGQMS